MNQIYVVGMGPGSEEKMTREAYAALEASDVIIGYTVYLELLEGHFRDKELLSTPMKQEVERCRMAFEKYREGKTVSMICSGDAGVYGMASLMFEVGAEYGNPEIKVIPGVTAALSGAAELGAPLSHDFCVISLSDLLTPWDTIEKRLRCAAEADFAIALYNPSSKKRADYLQKACDILMEFKNKDTCCGYVENIGREGCTYTLCSLEELRDRSVNMFTTVFIGNSMTKEVNGRMVTPRGYRGV